MNPSDTETRYVTLEELNTVLEYVLSAMQSLSDRLDLMDALEKGTPTNDPAKHPTSCQQSIDSAHGR